MLVSHIEMYQQDYKNIESILVMWIIKLDSIQVGIKILIKTLNSDKDPHKKAEFYKLLSLIIIINLKLKVIRQNKVTNNQSKV